MRPAYLAAVPQGVQQQRLTYLERREGRILTLARSVAFAAIIVIAIVLLRK